MVGNRRIVYKNRIIGGTVKIIVPRRKKGSEAGNNFDLRPEYEGLVLVASDSVDVLLVGDEERDLLLAQEVNDPRWLLLFLLLFLLFLLFLDIIKLGLVEYKKKRQC